MNIVILDDYQDAVRKLSCFSKLDAYKTQTYTNNVKGVGQLAVRLRDAEVVVLIKERTALSRQLIEKLPKLKLVVLTGPHNQTVDVPACTERGIAVATGNYDPSTTAELTWALLMAASRRIPQYVASLRQGAWQQSGLKSAAMPANFGLGTRLRDKTLGIWSFGRVGQIVAGYGRAFGMRVVVWGSDASRARALHRGALAPPRRQPHRRRHVAAEHRRRAARCGRAAGGRAERLLPRLLLADGFRAAGGSEHACMCSAGGAALRAHLEPEDDRSERCGGLLWGHL